MTFPCRPLFFVCLVCSFFFTCLSLQAQNQESLQGIEFALQEEYKEQTQQAEFISQREREASDELSQIERELSELSIAIYHQDNNNLFFLSYYCHEVSKLSRAFFSNQSPFYLMGQRVQSEITRLSSLKETLHRSHQENINDQETKTQLNRCIELTDKILTCYEGYQQRMNGQKKRFIRISADITALDLYANGDTVAHDDMKQSDSVTADQMILQLFDTTPDESTDSEETAADVTPVKKKKTATMASGVMAQRLVNQLFNPMSISSRIDTPPASHSYLQHVLLLPSEFIDQYSDLRNRAMIPVAIVLVISAAACALLTRLACSHLHRRRGSRLSPSRVTAFIRAGGLLLFSLIIGGYSFFVDEGYLQINLWNYAIFALMTASLFISLATHLTTPRIANGFSLFMPLVVLNATILLFSVFMSCNSIVLGLSPLLYLTTALLMAWFFIFRMSKLRISLRVYGFLSIIFLIFTSYASYRGYAYLMLMSSLSWYMLLVNIELIGLIQKLSRLLSRHLFSLPQLSEYKSFISLWLRLLTNNLIVPLVFLGILWYSIVWPASTLDLSHFLDSWMKMEYEFNTIIKSISASLLLQLITVAIITNCILRLVQQTLLLIYQNKHEGGRKLSLLTLISLVIWLAYILYCLIMMKANYQSILVILGGMSVGIGLGLKDNIENFISGMSLMTGRLRLGDTIECRGYRGRVSSIGFRTTTMETRSGAIICFQNKELFNENCLNLTRNHEYERAILTVGVPYGTDISQARHIIMTALAPLHSVVSQKHSYYVVLKDFGASSVDLAVYVWVPVLKRTMCKSLIKEAIYKALDKHGIEIPFPQCDLHIKGGVTDFQNRGHDKPAIDES